MSGVAGSVTAFLERVEFVRQEHGSCNVAKAFAVLRDNADDHEYKVAVDRDFALKLVEYLSGWDECDQSPPIEITLTVPE